MKTCKCYLLAFLTMVLIFSGGNVNVCSAKAEDDEVEWEVPVLFDGARFGMSASEIKALYPNDVPYAEGEVDWDEGLTFHEIRFVPEHFYIYNEDDCGPLQHLLMGYNDPLPHIYKNAISDYQIDYMLCNDRLIYTGISFEDYRSLARYSNSPDEYTYDPEIEWFKEMIYAISGLYQMRCTDYNLDGRYATNRNHDSRSFLSLFINFLNHDHSSDYDPLIGGHGEGMVKGWACWEIPTSNSFQRNRWQDRCCLWVKLHNQEVSIYMVSSGLVQSLTNAISWDDVPYRILNGVQTAW